jgi:CBS domain-containing protein
MALAELVREHILKTGQRCFIVVDGSRLEGLVTLHQIKAVPQEQWAQVSVGEAMTPVSQLRIVAPDQPLLDVLQLLEGRDINQVPVAAEGQLLGMITRNHLLQVLVTKMELDVPGSMELHAPGLSRWPRVSSTT